MANREISNLINRMPDRHRSPMFFARFRPPAQNVARARDIDGCEQHKTAFGRWFWDHQVIHARHGTNIRHSAGRCYFWAHRLPGEVGLMRARAYVTRGLWRDLRWNLLRLKWRTRGLWLRLKWRITAMRLGRSLPAA